jgi:hypothetical protein
MPGERLRRRQDEWVYALLRLLLKEQGADQTGCV